ncbi:conserved Plasmodium protein, unknown function [Plasmodium ovale wallikeri]|uniref:Uncharacterized protein n=1 Tax=Plasmodium ovale wallikeri TaxID=864142 RepID=A0A1A8ZD12_PLAOA|nr:conserved Plasmodium protein, unknown function [Plasmodium ovale wallikeri]SBT42166.1 conserved Plasmodium protein, unknown function [Plasmodium ovale wallikeri]
MSKIKGKKKSFAYPELPLKKHICSLAEEAKNSKGTNDVKTKKNNNSSCNGSQGQLNKHDSAVGDDNIIDKINELNLILIQNKDEINHLRQEKETFSSQVRATHICVYKHVRMYICRISIKTDMHVRSSLVSSIHVCSTTQANASTSAQFLPFQISNFVNKCKELQCMCTEKENEIIQLKEDEKKLVQQLNEHKREKAKLHEDIKHLLNTEKDKNVHIYNMGEQITKLKNDLIEKCNEIDSLNDRIKHLDEKIIILQNENVKSKIDVSNNAKRQDMINEHINEKENKIISLEVKVKKMNKVIKEKTDENENCKKKISQQNNKIAQLCEKIQHLEIGQQADMEKIKKFADNIKILKKKNNKREERNRESKMVEERKDNEDVLFNSQFYNLNRKRDNKGKHKGCTPTNDGKNSRKQRALAGSGISTSDSDDSDESDGSHSNGSGDGKIITFSSKYSTKRNEQKDVISKMNIKQSSGKQK